MYVAYWSDKCEEWFQARLKVLEGGNIKMNASGQWRTALKMDKLTGRLAENYEAAAHAFFRQVATRPRS